MFQQKKHSGQVRVICRTAILTALYVLLTMVSVRAGNLRITFASLPVVVCGVLFGPVQAGLVALLGEFLNQMLSYGFSATTVLWLVPPMVRGLLVGMAGVQCRKSETLLHHHPVWLYSVCLLAAVATTLCNTAVIYLDSRIYGYYTPGYVMGSFLLRLATGLVTAMVVTTVSVPLLRMLQRQLEKEY